MIGGRSTWQWWPGPRPDWPILLQKKNRWDLISRLHANYEFDSVLTPHLVGVSTAASTQTRQYHQPPREESPGNYTTSDSAILSVLNILYLDGEGVSSGRSDSRNGKS